MVLPPVGGTADHLILSIVWPPLAPEHVPKPSRDISWLYPRPRAVPEAAATPGCEFREVAVAPTPPRAPGLGCRSQTRE
ncbi:unnamed protein product [Rangifer tarandus platyrhynchus]|uniref:Uncharacterized protein n=1 Tax=Rangifer tarandus platyrhynchus TaxID=3082113 RepID=A0AC59YPF7_RANTA